MLHFDLDGQCRSDLQSIFTQTPFSQSRSFEHSRSTLHRGGKLHFPSLHTFVVKKNANVWNSDFKAFGNRKSCLWEKDEASKDDLFQIHFTIWSLKYKMTQKGGRGRVRKVPKKFHVLFEWPLNSLARHLWVNDLGEVAPRSDSCQG